MNSDRNLLTPKYYLIYEELCRQFEAGKYPVGTKIPSESELCEIHGVSRGTVREAVKLLIQQGVLTRERGRGTFVTEKEDKIAQDAQRLIGFTELMQQHGKKAHAKIFRRETVKPNSRIQRLLELKSSEKVVEIERLRFGDDEPLIIERSYYVYGYFYQILEFDLEKESIYEVLHRETDVRLGEAHQTIEAVKATPEDAKMLRIPPGDPLLLIKRLIRTKDDRLFQYTEDLYRSDRLNFKIHTQSYDEYQHDFKTPLRIQARGE
ncbi:GntR family transcriptional regulator [Gemmobacter caeruleus]|uniref:GntR family transcriptional regulator n=1 Tax=Gemmobacter caeruleus TaxID=2595004 RepID=UPI0013968FB2|nr:GntR family transcriptional regulator [Gemmobacter caeruleus]